jgi:hypothetical protein
MDTLRFGILSTSSIAPRFIAAVRAQGAGEILALSSRTVEKAREKAAAWDIPRSYGSHRALLEDKDVNIVYISTVNAQHYAWAREALLAGKNVICEKPMTTSEETTRELFALAREKGCFLMEAEKMLFLPAILAVRDLAQLPLNEQIATYRQFVEDIASLWLEMWCIYHPEGLTMLLRDGSEEFVEAAALRELRVGIRIDISSESPYSRFAAAQALDGLFNGGHLTLEEYVSLLGSHSALPKGKLEQLLQSRASMG